MEAVAALGHFCEAHGPRVVLATQAFRQCDAVDAHPCDSGSDLDELAVSPADTAAPFYGDVRELSALVDEDAEYLCGTAHCAACCAAGGQSRPAYVLSDAAAGASYVGSERPYGRQWRDMAEHAVVATLTWEMAPGGSGHLFFGDAQHGYTASYTVHLSDSKARGFVQTYCVAVLAADRLMLINDYDGWKADLQTIGDKLRALANKTFQSEQGTSKEVIMRDTARRAALLPQGFLKGKCSGLVSDTARPLTQLTGDKDIFAKLHVWFAWLLRRAARRNAERLMHAAPSEDAAVMAERRRSGIDDDGQAHAAHSTGQQLVASLPAGSMSSSVASGIHFDAERRSRSPPDSVCGTPATADGQCGDLATLVRRLRADEAALLLCHLVTGAQILIYGGDTHASKHLGRLRRNRLLDALASLLPLGCVTVYRESAVYRHVYECNLLSLCAPLSDWSAAARDTGVPFALHIADDDAAQRRSSDTALADVEANGYGDDTAVDLWHGVTFRLMSLGSSECVQPLPAGQTPAVVQRYQCILCDECVHAASIEALVRAAKEHWLNKAKLHFQVTRHADARGYDRKALLSTVLKCSPADERVARFWIKGLSKSSRSFTLHTVAGKG